MKVYDLGLDVRRVAHAVGSSRWPWGWHWRALCGAKVIRFDRPFYPGRLVACRDCSRYAKTIGTR